MTRSRIRCAERAPAWTGPGGASTLAGVDAGADVPGTDTPVPIDGRCFAYVFPCRWEDHCKIGFSNDPLARIASLHPRWYEFFDLERGFLVQAESQRDARDLELELRAALGEYNAPAPLAIRAQAGGHTEWFRGIASLVCDRVAVLAARGYRVPPLQAWLCSALAARRDLLHDWSLVQLSIDELDGRTGPTPAQRMLRDLLDAHDALQVPVDGYLPASVRCWYRSV